MLTFHNAFFLSQQTQRQVYFVKLGYFQYFDFISKPGYASFVTDKHLRQSLNTSTIALFEINREKMKKKAVVLSKLNFLK